MKTNNTYIAPEIKLMMMNAKEMVMQDVFSGGDSKGTGIVVSKEADESTSDNRANRWSNHLWDEEE